MASILAARFPLWTLRESGELPLAQPLPAAREDWPPCLWLTCTVRNGTRALPPTASSQDWSPSLAPAIGLPLPDPLCWAPSQERWSFFVSTCSNTSVSTIPSEQFLSTVCAAFGDQSHSACLPAGNSGSPVRSLLTTPRRSRVSFTAVGDTP